MAVSHDVTLAWIAFIAWAGPGTLWWFSPWLAVGVLLALSGILLAWLGQKEVPALISTLTFVFLGVVVSINLVWGNALLASLVDQ